MSDIIQLLPDSVANQIAAGEVIQRPASVIKELVENAVDAGATQIQVQVVDAGRTSIQVIDNGKGMSTTDARLAFERHATSKIKEAADLFDLHTMGFRGEALASIAAVAQVELKTRLRDKQLGTHLTISGGRVLSQEPCSCPEGSNFLVENLFFNVPARRKFLKSNSTEMNHIVVAYERIALVYPDIAFSLYSNGTEVSHLPAASLKQRIVDIFGKRLSQELLSLNSETSLCKLSGFVGKPEAARKKGVNQYFFVNGRYMRHPYFNKAVQTALERLIQEGDQVPYFIYFEVPPECIDVNIHPTKTEIKFDNEQAIWQILSATIKEAVGNYSNVPTIDFDTEGKPDIPVFNPNQNNIQPPKDNFKPEYNPFKKETTKNKTVQNTDWQELYRVIEKEQPQENGFFDEQQTPSLMETEEKTPMHYQYKGMYILTSVKSGLMIIDQHRAHIRILYEQYLQQVEEHIFASQRALFPEIVQLSLSENVVFSTILTEMNEMGFELTDLGGGSYAINAFPTGLDGLDMTRLVTEMVTTAVEEKLSMKEEINQNLAFTLAKNAAIPYGQVLSNEEMEAIVNGLFLCDNVNYTPDGKHILTILPQTKIEQLLN